MEKSSNVYGPIFKKIMEIQEASPEDRENLLNQLYELNQNVGKKFDMIDEEYNQICNSNIELEDRIKELYMFLDKKMEETRSDNMCFSQLACIEIYNGYWDKLDGVSQKYLIMADYLYRVLKNTDADFSPLVLEYGRAVENELVKKIYEGFVISLSGHTSNMIDSGSRYGELKSAVRNYTNSDGSTFIAPRAMIKYLGFLSDEEIQNDYNNALKKYLDDKNIDREPISKQEFISMADELFAKYRNKAAHQGKTMIETEASGCKEKSKKVLKRFMSAI